MHTFVIGACVFLCGCVRLCSWLPRTSPAAASSLRVSPSCPKVITYLRLYARAQHATYFPFPHGHTTPTHTYVHTTPSLACTSVHAHAHVYVLYGRAPKQVRVHSMFVGRCVNKSSIWRSFTAHSKHTYVHTYARTYYFPSIRSAPRFFFFSWSHVSMNELARQAKRCLDVLYCSGELTPGSEPRV